jgi:hypothetical protein
MARVQEKASPAPDEHDARQRPKRSNCHPAEPKPLLVVRRIDSGGAADHCEAKHRRLGAAQHRHRQPCAEYDGCPRRFEMLVRSPAHQWRMKRRAAHAGA